VPPIRPTFLQLENRFRKQFKQRCVPTINGKLDRRTVGIKRSDPNAPDPRAHGDGLSNLFWRCAVIARTDYSAAIRLMVLGKSNFRIVDAKQTSRTGTSSNLLVDPPMWSRINSAEGPGSAREPIFDRCSKDEYLSISEAIAPVAWRTGIVSSSKDMGGCCVDDKIVAAQQLQVLPAKNGDAHRTSRLGSRHNFYTCRGVQIRYDPVCQRDIECCSSLHSIEQFMPLPRGTQFAPVIDGNM